MKEITIHSNNKYLELLDNALYNSNLGSLVYCPSAIGDEYTVANGTKQLMGGSFISTTAKYIYLPETLLEIGSYCFSNSKTLINITIPNNVTSIGRCAFQNCKALTLVILPSSLTSLGGGVFAECSSFIKVTFDSESQYELDPQNLIINKNHTEISQCLSSDKQTYIINQNIEDILDRAFQNHGEITTIKFEDDSQLVNIHDYAFYNCFSLTTIHFPNSLRSIGPCAFQSCSSLTTITFPQSITDIGDNAFEGCTTITSIIFPNKTQTNTIKYLLSDQLEPIYISKSAFSNCNKLSTLNFGDSVQSIGNNCFENCYELKTVEFPESIQSLGTSVFINCKSLISCNMAAINEIDGINASFFYNSTSFCDITFPQVFYSIGSKAFSLTAIREFTLPECVVTLDLSSFEGCIQLETFTIQDYSNLTNIKGSVFSGCTNFSQINVGNFTNFQNWSSALFTKNMSSFIVLPPKSDIKYFAFPETVENIEQCALAYCTNIEVIFLPKSIRTIQTMAFYFCKNLRYINIPEGVQIDDNVFSGCTNLQCGIAIEESNEIYRNKLVEYSKLPKYALSPCIRFCTSCQSSTIRLSSLVFITLIKSSFQ